MLPQFQYAYAVLLKSKLMLLDEQLDNIISVVFSVLVWSDLIFGLGFSF